MEFLLAGHNGSCVSGLSRLLLPQPVESDTRVVSTANLDPFPERQPVSHDLDGSGDLVGRVRQRGSAPKRQLQE